MKYVKIIGIVIAVAGMFYAKKSMEDRNNEKVKMIESFDDDRPVQIPDKKIAPVSKLN